MVRDMDLARKILLEIEKQPYDGGFRDVAIQGYDTTTISYHVMLMHEAGYIEAIDCSSHDEPCAWQPTRLTWEGHEFLEAARDDGIWKKALAVMKDKSGGIVVDVLKELLVGMVRGSVLG